MRFPWQRPPPPPPPPPPPKPSVHALLGVSREACVGAALFFSLLALLCLLVSFRKRRVVRGPPLVSLESTAAARGKVAVLRAPEGSALAHHVRRLLLQRGFAEVRSAQGDASFVGAHVAIDMATASPPSDALAGTEALLSRCRSHAVGAALLLSDAMLAFDEQADLTDGDERPDAGPSLLPAALQPKPLPAPRPSPLMQAHARCEEALKAHHSRVGGASFSLRLHRVYEPHAPLPPSLLLLLAAVGTCAGGARAQTNLLHVEDAALAVVLAVDKAIDGYQGYEEIVLTDPTVWPVAYLLKLIFTSLRLPPPFLPTLPLLLPLLSLAFPTFARVAQTHCYFTGEKAKSFLCFEPRVGSAGLFAFLHGQPSSFPLPLALPLALLAVAALTPPPLAAALLAAALLALAASLRPLPSSLPPLPPIAPPLVAGGLPLLGHLLPFIRGPVGMIHQLRRRYRSLFTIRVGPQRITFMIGAEAQLAFIKQKDELLDQAPVYRFTVPVFGKGIVYDSPLDERLQQVKLLVHSMNTKSLEAMVPKMIGEAEDYFRAWGEEGTVELREVFSELIIMTASACLMGREVREELSAKIARIYHSLDGGLTPLSTLWPHAPTAKHRERDAARLEMVALFSPIIAARRAGAVEDDFLQKIIDFRYKAEVDRRTGETLPGRQFTDSEVTGWLIVLLFAGQHTSSITATWLGALLLSNPEVLAEVRAEQEAKVPDEASLTYSALLEMDTMRHCITEALRLYPPLILLMRKVMKHGFKVGAHTIPKGDVVGLCAPASNTDPRYWHDPTAFRPSRFGVDGKERHAFDSHSVGHGSVQGLHLSFGGGAHMCSGRRFGYLQVSTIWAILLRDFDLSLESPLPPPAYNDMVVGPAAPVLVRYKRKHRDATPTSPPQTTTPPPPTTSPPPPTATPPPPTTAPPPTTTPPPPSTSPPPIATPPPTAASPPSTTSPPPATSPAPPATKTPPSTTPPLSSSTPLPTTPPPTTTPPPNNQPPTAISPSSSAPSISS